MANISPIFTSEGKTKWSLPNISKAELNANFNRSFVAPLIVAFQITVLLKILPSFQRVNSSTLSQRILHMGAGLDPANVVAPLERPTTRPVI